MDLLPTDEQAEIASTVHNALEAAFPLNDRDRFDVIGAQETLLSGERPGGGDPLIDDARWAGFGELGWFSLGLAEADGGVGYGLAEEVLLAEELGRQVAPGPFVAQIVASRLAAAAQLDAAADLAAGTLRAAWGEPVVSAEGSPAVIGDRTTADLLVQHAEGAAWIVVVSGDEAVLISSEDVEVLADVAPLDPSTPLRRVRANAVIPGASDPSGATARWATTLVSAQMAGLAEATCAMSVEYAKEREQFGQPIGSFQAVKHLCAEMAAELEPSRSLVWYAAYAFDDAPAEAGLTAAHAKAHTSEIGRFIARTATEVHGGMGITDLLGLHYWFKRIGLNRQLLGGPERVRRIAARMQGLAA